MAIDGYIIQIDHSDIKKMTAELQKIGVNINQIAKRANATGNMYQEDIEISVKQDTTVFYKICAVHFSPYGTERAFQIQYLLVQLIACLIGNGEKIILEITYVFVALPVFFLVGEKNQIGLKAVLRIKIFGSS